MNTTLTRIAMAAPIVAALLALTSGWDVAQAQPGPQIDDITTNQPVVDPQPQPPKWQHPDIDLGDITVDPDPKPPADDPAPPADTDDDADHDDDSDHDDSDDNTHGATSTGGTSRPAVEPTPTVEETDTVFQASDARNASESISPKFLPGTGVQQPPAGVIFGLGAVLVAVIGWAAFRHHRLSV